MAHPQTSFSSTVFTSPTFIYRRRETAYKNTLPYQLDILKSTGRYDAFKLQWHECNSDKPDVWPDGYLNIHFTVVEREKRWSNLRDLHELYNAGHLIEGALAHKKCFGNDLLMGPILKYVDLICTTFGPGPDQKHGYPGHPEIELALMRLYEETKNPKHFALAEYFWEERGDPKGRDGRHYYDVEAEARGDKENERPAYCPKVKILLYQQAHQPILEQQTIEGHSVRAMYLLTRLADLVRTDGPSNDKTNPRMNALKSLWGNMVDKKWEGFGIEYFLPSSTDEGGCYAETCASIGVMMLAERLLQVELDGSYADIIELNFSNAVMTGMSATGKQFTYVNQLASSDKDLSKSAKWFTCASCPPNVTRLLGYIGGYIWNYAAEEQKGALVNIHLYTSAVLSIPVGDRTIDFEVRNAENVETTMKVRIPELSNAQVEKGYLTLPAEWTRQNPKFQLNIPLDVVALARGPIVYCAEDFDNAWVDDHFKSLAVDPACTISESNINDVAIGEPYYGLTVHNGASLLEVPSDLRPQLSLGSSPQDRKSSIEKLHFVPYVLRGNRGGKGHMRVGLRRSR
ncbi:hypothetical protein BJ875DRAFT_538337 [Amylocarpus encephaloides]|uniref:Glycoside hydrolase family 127 protein n=1 Tax=Amylocarpus encephaloides TaxID=45428 RepID=A0A9P7Y7R1_9HELO|nr:hypothetical protein BJ875DRAFT_538337 [Amylocarpus encephaloides]